MSGKEKISLKAYWEAVEQRLEDCSAEQLRGILRAMAKETLPAARHTFLAKLTLPQQESVAALQEEIEQEDLLDDIDDFAEELEAEMEDAEYREERYGGGEYDDEDSLGPYRESVEPLTKLFDRTEAVFDSGDLALARAAYKKLFEALHLEDDYGRGVSGEDLPNVDISEASARYLRAVYETEKPARRPKALFDEMQQVRSSLYLKQLKLDDLIQISPKPLPDRDQFLSDWTAFLRQQSGHEADAWLREAISLSQGTKGLAELAQTEGTKRPRAYLDWFAALDREGKHREILTAAEQALQTLAPKLPIRAAIADHLCAAAVKLKNVEALRAGRWEAFTVKPTLERLLDLREATAEAERTETMQRAAEQIKEYLAHPPRQEMSFGWDRDDLESPAWIDKAVLAHAYFFAGAWEEAHELAAREKVLGWSGSNNPQGLVVPLFLVLLSGRSLDALPPNLKHLWQEGLQTSAEFGWTSAEAAVLKRLERVYRERLPQIHLDDAHQADVLAWCLKVAKQRVKEIVGNQHRRAYDRAAKLIAACAEALRLRGEDKKAGKLLEDIRNEYPRHRAFQSELNAAVQRR
jgi:soluble cytochrome b562